MELELVYTKDEFHEDLVKRYLNGQSVKQLSVLWRKNPETIKKILRAHNVALRDTWGKGKQNIYKDAPVLSKEHQRIGSAISDLEISRRPFYSTEDLSYMLRLSTEEIGPAKLGKVDVPLNTVLLLAKALGCSVDDILTGKRWS